MATKRNSSYLEGAAILAGTIVITKIIGFLYKIPLYNLLGDEGSGLFQSTYTVYNLLLTISTAGIPVALSRLISAARATGRYKQVRKYFSLSLASFSVIGAICMIIMLLFPEQLASFIGTPEIKLGLIVLAPAVLFSCIISVYRGYAQGFSDMLPTSISQIIEVASKLVFGIAIAWILTKTGAKISTISAGAIAGSTIGLGISIPLLVLYKNRVSTKVSSRSELDPALSSSETLKLIYKICIPITLSSSILNIISLIDTKLIYSRLQAGAGLSYYQSKILYGVYGKAQTLFNIPSAFIVPITVAVVPAISAYIARHDREGARSTMESSLKVTTLFALPAGVGLCVLSYPIFNVLYPGSNENGPALLAVLGIASFFVCIQLITNAFLQASGYEKIALLALPLGGIVKIIVNWILVGNENINIMGAPVGTLCCYIAITAFNIYFIKNTMRQPPRFLKTLLKPIICTAIMAVAALGTYSVLGNVVGLSQSKIGMMAAMVVAIIVAVIAYVIAVYITGTITKEDMRFVPKGDKIAKVLKLK